MLPDSKSTHKRSKLRSCSDFVNAAANSAFRKFPEPKDTLPFAGCCFLPIPSALPARPLLKLLAPQTKNPPLAGRARIKKPTALTTVGADPQAERIIVERQLTTNGSG